MKTFSMTNNPGNGNFTAVQVNPNFNYSLDFNSHDVRPSAQGTGATWLVENVATSRNIAVIELSTKAVKLLVGMNPDSLLYEGFSYSYFFRETKRTETGMLLDYNNKMNLTMFKEKVLPFIKKYAEMARDEYHVDVIYTVATAAYRAAENKNSVLRLIRCETGLDVKILSKAEEATATLWAYSCSTKNPERLKNANLILLDQGGGSTEISFFRGQELLKSQSLSIGTSYLKTLLFRQMNSNLAEVLERVCGLAETRMENELKDVNVNMSNSLCIAVGRAITAATGKIGNRNQHERSMTIEYLKNKKSEVQEKLGRRFATVADLKRAWDAQGGKADELDAELCVCLGLAAVLPILEHCGLESITVNGTGLFYGIYFEKFYNIK